MMNPIFGKLSWNSFPFSALIKEPSLNNWIACGGAFAIIMGFVSIIFILIRYKLWKNFWNNWIKSPDHKKIGIMYLSIAIVMLIRAVMEGIILRVQQMTSLHGGIIEPDHFSQIFSTHGTIMIFFVAMPLIIGLMNYIVPLQIGARDVAFPVLNQMSLGFTLAGASLMMMSLVIGRFETGGWTAYPPYTGIDFSPDVGPDYWIWSVFISGVGSLMSGINFTVTIYKLRTPGMTLMRMPLFTWTALCSSIMLIYAMPAITTSTLMLAADRYLGWHFFTNDLGGNMMNYANIFWMFGHPEVYILVLPAFGVFSEISSTFSSKVLYGYKSLVIATMSIAVISFTVWLHHFFTMGQSAYVNVIFGIATMVIAIPTGIKVYDWMATLYGGKIRMTTPMIYLIGFFILFVIGGLSGILLANPSIDFQVHNSVFLVAHFHNVIIPGVLFGLLAGIHYWFPKMFGYSLNEKYGKISAYLWIFGFIFTFMPLYWLGLQGLPRRSPEIHDASFQPWLIVSGIGAFMMLGALSFLIYDYYISYIERDTQTDPKGDPWDGRTLEWSIPSPPPEWNFAVLPKVDSRDFWYNKKQKEQDLYKIENYEDIELAPPSTMGFQMAAYSFIMGFSLIWHIWWLAILAVSAIIVSIIVRSCMIIKPSFFDKKEVKETWESIYSQKR
ncbi:MULTISPECIES: cbb3-type cytochrome c oxidase subunit I [Chryseobacterium]|uniref:Cytochrome o ubiquinol oxidase subunit 1 n=1 Tax=Chryseobacterium camelliae TaxID=1265445 RepID=A0ABU0TG40_9FLAO|nr:MULTISPECIES: cbb3-type cytochrome c oxidase subunit I [Chryseobacterium]MDT3406982.1 cytochrome o ubiquinol oxidase subunit 1 [Pseudacidovorax intermedius]MDQ1095225.1 cytochrome o ubiquinol oxidase subunit 1 [Chryseobacterium camelliae]MDQ1099163.1 cytochrome o ubiquinol oxidase subunit 1 [Chryseobacterium sp. SORGH_AS_1048]MDR6086512.1 cytochrome o ubiquinol oxidase subunit 1 [Chryseobacterium sp. SORGH_AS_0909]MDR6130883.1 cytochrome o ubiquinol oxidase subunit 1 [Chryseobacterium sp. S